ncbi:histidine phosphatase family protein [Vibrio metschnikovii]|uniref:Histidine phosphatase family protein n=3 Tax=Unclassified Bacteria TaxID=49928 RepID=A0AAU6UXQ3_UNCXX|nr:histidine phosphatase family protein [Vibrio metschnikovii]EKO3589599.1 histidine phosphatase family protein [Vibrio metschnikovii]EKO3642208.1 histidine phosphatase family protein [Vibrio metschnikovii]EKO3657341.1 histidine phosphatase family protein [Vibrio metschnikovii]EKO3665457.1 histidine phosphatase family protein [Vibrio metschnikovii]
MRLILLRHGETLWNIESRLQGHANSELSIKGVKQAEDIKKYIKILAPNRVITSDLGRTVQTSTIIGYPDAERDSMIRELNMGDWTGKSKIEIMNSQPELYRDWRDGNYTPIGGENWFEFCDRIKVGFSRRIVDDAGDLLAVVHSGVIRAACKVFLNISPDHLLPSTPGTLTIINFKDKTSPKLEAYNIGSFIPDVDVSD